MRNELQLVDVSLESPALNLALDEALLEQYEADAGGGRGAAVLALGGLFCRAGLRRSRRSGGGLGGVRRGGHERPHRPVVVLLSVLDLLDRSLIVANEMPSSEELVATLKRCFAVVREADDRPSFENPFYFLGGDKFWQVTPAGGDGPLYREGFAAGAPGVGQSRKDRVAGHFDGRWWALLSDPLARHQVREALIARYFPPRLPQQGSPQSPKFRSSLPRSRRATTSIDPSFFDSRSKPQPPTHTSHAHQRPQN